MSIVIMWQWCPMLITRSPTCCIIGGVFQPPLRLFVGLLGTGHGTGLATIVLEGKPEGPAVLLHFGPGGSAAWRDLA